MVFTDTVSLAYEIQTEDFYKAIAEDIETRFGTSDYPVVHSSLIKTGINKKVFGMFKDEAGGKQIEEFAGLRANLYSYKMDGEDHKSTKALRNIVLEDGVHTLPYGHYSLR